jgi:hypothetical protein
MSDIAISVRRVTKTYRYNAPKIPNTHSPEFIFQPDRINPRMESQTMERAS